MNGVSPPIEKDNQGRYLEGGFRGRSLSKVAASDLPGEQP